VKKQSKRPSPQTIEKEAQAAFQRGEKIGGLLRRRTISDNKGHTLISKKHQKGEV